MSEEFSLDTLRRLDILNWIDEASNGLEPIAREKIEQQILEHYGDALANYRSSGDNREIAHLKILQDLGSSKIARHKYSKIYFPEKYLESFKSFDNLASFFLVYSIALVYFKIEDFNFGYYLISEQVDEYGRQHFMEKATQIFSTTNILSTVLLIFVISLGYLRLRMWFSKNHDHNYNWRALFISITSLIIVTSIQIIQSLNSVYFLPSFLFWLIIFSNTAYAFMSIKLLLQYAKRKKLIGW